MTTFYKNQISLLLLFLTSTCSSFSGKRPSCTMDGMKGPVPEDVCLITNFIKSLPQYDPTAPEIHPRNNYVFFGKPGTGKTTCIELIEKETGAIVLRYDLPTFVENCGDINEVYKNAEEILKREKRPVILVFENVDHAKTRGGILHTVIQNHSGNAYIWTITTAHDFLKTTEGFQNRCAPVKFELPDRSIRKETIQEETYKRNLIMPWMLLTASSILSSGKSIGDIKQTLDKITKTSDDSQPKTIQVFHELSKQNYLTAGIAGATSIAVICALLYGVQSGKVLSLLQRIFSQKSNTELSAKTTTSKGEKWQ